MRFSPGRAAYRAAGAIYATNMPLRRNYFGTPLSAPAGRSVCRNKANPPFIAPAGRSVCRNKANPPFVAPAGRHVCSRRCPPHSFSAPTGRHIAPPGLKTKGGVFATNMPLRRSYLGLTKPGGGQAQFSPTPPYFCLTLTCVKCTRDAQVADS